MKRLITPMLLMLALWLPALAQDPQEVYIEDFAIEPGQGMTVPVMLHCVPPSRGIQFNLTLSEGLSLDEIELTQASKSLTMNLFSSKHSQGYYVIGTYPSERVCYDTVATAVVELSVSAAEDFEGGTMRVWHVRGATLDNKSIKMDDDTTTVTALGRGETSGLTLTGADEVSPAVVQTTYYAPSGSVMAQPSGLTIEVTRREDGSQATRKRLAP